jgi:multiple sugar transport system permease protein
MSATPPAAVSARVSAVGADMTAGVSASARPTTGVDASTRGASPLRARRSVRHRLVNLPAYVALSVLSLVSLFPFWWMLTTSLKEPARIFVFPPQFLPSPIRWDNYADVLRTQPFHLYYWNSLYIAVLVTVGTCALASLAGYGFARLQFPLRNALFVLLLSALMVPVEVTAVPNFILMRTLGLVNTHIPLILPPVLGAGGVFGVFLMRQFFLSIPVELEEAAKIDGLTPFGTFWRIVLPLAQAPLATLAIFTFLASWNEFFDPLIYLNSKPLYTLPLALALYTDEAGTAWHLLMAASVLATLPLILIFFVAQRRFIEGIALTGLKGT